MKKYAKRQHQIIFLLIARLIYYVACIMLFLLIRDWHFYNQILRVSKKLNICIFCRYIFILFIHYLYLYSHRACNWLTLVTTNNHKIIWNNEIEQCEIQSFVRQLQSSAAKIARGRATVFQLPLALLSGFKPINSRPFNWIKIAFKLH